VNVRGRTLSRIFVAVAVLWSCGPPPRAPVAEEGEAGLEAGAGPTTDALPEPAADGENPGDAPAATVPAGPGEAPFRDVLAALASGSARAVRGFVPGGGLLRLRSRICRQPLYGVGTCRDEQVDAERQQIDDEALAAWQDGLARAGAAGAPFSTSSVPVRCAGGGAAGRVECSTVLPLGVGACRGEQSATVGAVLQDAGESWALIELSYEEQTLVCE